MAAKTKTIKLVVEQTLKNGKPTDVVGLSASQRAPIVKVWADSVKSLSTVGGELVEGIVAVTRKVLESDYVLTTADAHVLSADAARVCGWKKDKHGKYGSRASEIKHIVTARASLGTAIKECRKAMNACTWHDSIALAKDLNAGKSVATAIRNVKAKRAATGASEPETSADAKRMAATRIKPMLTWSKLPREFKAQLRQLCAEHTIKV